MTVLNHFFSKDVKWYTDELRAVDQEQRSLRNYSPALFDRLKAAEARITEQCKKVEGHLKNSNGAIQQAKAGFREKIAPWYEQSYLMKRATEKPRGYPGDYVILEAIYDNVARSPGIGYYLDRLFLSDELALAVRNRKDLIREKLRKEIETAPNGLRLMNLASGSCREWYELIPRLDGKRLNLVCLDFDQTALDYAENRLDGYAKRLKIRFVKDNVLRLAKRKDNRKRYGLQDIIYSFGLYDYLPDKSLKALFKSQLDLLNGGGRMILTFKDNTEYDGTKHAWFCDWYFQERSEQDVLKLFADLGIDDEKVTITWENSNTIAFFDIMKG